MSFAVKNALLTFSRTSSSFSARSTYGLTSATRSLAFMFSSSFRSLASARIFPRPRQRKRYTGSFAPGGFARSGRHPVERLTRRVLRFRWPILLGWIVVTVVSAVASSGLGSLLTNRFQLPGTDTARAENILEHKFNQRTAGSFTIVVST